MIQNEGSVYRGKTKRALRGQSSSLHVSPFRLNVPHLFKCWDQISGRIRPAKDIRLFLDFDGTLMPYRDRPENVELSAALQRTLRRLTQHPVVHLAIVSGRRNAVLSKLIRLPNIQYLGLYGWERQGRPPLQQRTRRDLPALRSQLASLARGFPGIGFEDKGVSFAMHFRGVAPGAQRQVRLRISRLLTPMSADFHVIPSNTTWEVAPRQMRGKGVAMREVTGSLRNPFLPIYAGDDLTDEPAFAALRSGITVRVGPTSRTIARFRLRNPEEVHIFLERLEEELS